MTADTIALHARLSPRRLAARDIVLGQEWTYVELDALIGRLAAELLARECAAGERIAVLARNSVWLVALHLACARVGAIYVPLNWRLTSSELAALLERAEPLLFLSDVAGAPAGEAWPSLALADFVAAADTREPDAGGDHVPDRPSLILFTSGTSGRPKGVVLTERNLQQTAINFATLSRVSADSLFLCEAPMFHVIGLVTNIRPVLQAGGAILVSDGFEPARTLAWLSDPLMGITHYVGVPQMVEALRAQPGFDPAGLRRMTGLVTGGAPHSPADIQAWIDDGVAIVSGYGMSEVGTVFGMPTDLEMIRAKAGAAGVATPWVETRIVGPDGQDCPPDVAGELLLRGPNVTPGYWRDPEETGKAIDPAGWFATGDIVRADAHGFFWIVDRKKDMFISGGENVYPAEIEAHLAGYEGIAECALVGVPDPRWGEVGHLAIVRAQGHAIEAEAVLSHLGTRLARYKMPKQVSILEALPRTATGKLQKAALRILLIG